MNMKQKLSLTTVATLASPLALAHGEHQGSGLAGALSHQFTSLDHLAMLAVLGGALYFVLKLTRSERKRDDQEGR
ncbi:hypothetical protein GCM10011348_22470 [Marinobacterium nitratireducens]|uniref:Uncharacterized protein n=1 Tax=Marinobacterium nitratireducens TaxID=518897 RepID=A0A917ZFY4_9GAMM|nr:HupE/UreJ family protein [Marinobacterium nitratireducens]GGO82043.1 hypothetical protein GCM10011348_22470 [Marinobacterium nitratireducens]